MTGMKALKFASNFSCAVKIKMRHFFKSLWQQMKCGCTITNLKPCVSLWSDLSKIYLHKGQWNMGFGGETYGNSVLGCSWSYPHGFLWTWDSDQSRVILFNISNLQNNNWQGFKGIRRMFCCRIALLGHTLHMPLWEELRGWISPFCHILHTVWTCHHAVFMSFQVWKKTFVDIVFEWSSGKECQNLAAETMCGVVLWGLCGTFFIVGGSLCNY